MFFVDPFGPRRYHNIGPSGPSSCIPPPVSPCCLSLVLVMVRSRVRILCPLLGLALLVLPLMVRRSAEAEPGATLARGGIQPFLKTYYAECHGGKKPKGDLYPLGAVTAAPV